MARHRRPAAAAKRTLASAWRAADRDVGSRATHATLEEDSEAGPRAGKTRSSGAAQASHPDQKTSLCCGILSDGVSWKKEGKASRVLPVGPQGHAGLFWRFERCHRAREAHDRDRQGLD